MKKFLSLLLVLGMCSIASADLVTITGVPAEVNTGAGDVRFTFDIVSAGLLSNAVLDVFATNGGILDITEATNLIGSGDLDDDPMNRDWLPGWVDTSNVTQPVLWASTALPIVPAVPHIGDLITGIGLTVASGYEGPITISVLDETGDELVGSVQFNAVPEPITMALLGLGGLFLRRRK